MVPPKPVLEIPMDAYTGLGAMDRAACAWSKSDARMVAPKTTIPAMARQFTGNWHRRLAAFFSRPSAPTFGLTGGL
jgi:hypothetical protein